MQVQPASSQEPQRAELTLPRSWGAVHGLSAELAPLQARAFNQNQPCYIPGLSPVLHTVCDE